MRANGDGIGIAAAVPVEDVRIAAAALVEADIGPARFVPQPPQNLLSGELMKPQCAHLQGSVAPHCVQKRPLSELSA